MKPEDDVLVWGALYSADFSERTLTIRVEGDMPSVSRGRYVILPDDRFRNIARQAQLWSQQQRKPRA